MTSANLSGLDKQDNLT